MAQTYPYTWEEAVLWLREQPEHEALVRAAYYDDPITTAAARYHESEEWKSVRSLLGAQTGRVLDLGAGRGISSYAFARDGSNVTTVEPDGSTVVGAPVVAHLAKEMGLPVRVVRASGECLPLKEGIFDVVYGRAVLHHAQDLGRFCEEAARVLKRNGLFLATREHVIFHDADLSLFLKAHPLHHLYGGENAYRSDAYTGAIKAAGLRIKRVIGPWENAVNYSPATEEKCASLTAEALATFMGKHLGRMLASWRVVRRLYLRMRSRRSRTPGCHYSFLAVKE